MEAILAEREAVEQAGAAETMQRAARARKARRQLAERRETREAREAIERAQAEKEAAVEKAKRQQAERMQRYHMGEPELRKMFDEVDVDKSGALDRGEIRDLARRLGKILMSHEVDAAMDEMDADGNDSVDFEEFVLWWREYARKDTGVFGGVFGKFGGLAKARIAGSWRTGLRLLGFIQVAAKVAPKEPKPEPLSADELAALELRRDTILTDLTSEQVQVDEAHAARVLEVGKLKRKALAQALAARETDPLVAVARTAGKQKELAERLLTAEAADKAKADRQRRRAEEAARQLVPLPAPAPPNSAVPTLASPRRTAAQQELRERREKEAHRPPTPPELEETDPLYKYVLRIQTNTRARIARRTMAKEDPAKYRKLLDTRAQIACPPAAAEAFKKGSLHLRNQWWSTALPAFMEASAAGHPRPSRCYNGIGLCHLGLGSAELAVEYFSRALNADPDDPRAYRNRAQSYAALGHGLEAKADRYRAAELDKDVDPAQIGGNLATAALMGSTPRGEVGAAPRPFFSRAQEKTKTTALPDWLRDPDCGD
jgi:tetratricopeptide (TPR) repeat protein